MSQRLYIAKNGARKRYSGMAGAPLGAGASGRHPRIGLGAPDEERSGVFFRSGATAVVRGEKHVQKALYSKKRRPGALFRNGGRPRGWIESTLTAHMARTALRPHSRFGPCRPKETGGTGGLPSDAGVGFSVPLSAPGEAVHMGELGHWCDAALSKNGGDPSHREYFALSLWCSRDLWCCTHFSRDAFDTFYIVKY